MSLLTTLACKPSLTFLIFLLRLSFSFTAQLERKCC